MTRIVRGSHRVITARLLLRAWRESDAPTLMSAVESSLPELRRWLSWARDWRGERSATEDLLREFAAAFEEGRDWMYGIFDAADGSVLGGTGLHPWIGPDALEIGYWIRTDAAGRGYATETAAALTRVGFERHGVARVEIRCDEGNDASARIPARLGFRRVATIESPLKTLEGGSLRRHIWALDREGYAASPAARAAIEIREGRGPEDGGGVT